jgi:hypothetical protein
MNQMNKLFKKWVIKFLLRHILISYSVEELLLIDHQSVSVGKRTLTEEDETRLENEAKRFHKSLLWLLMKNNVQYLAVDRSVKNSKNEYDVIFGQAMIVVMEILDNFIKQAKELKKAKQAIKVD